MTIPDPPTAEQPAVVCPYCGAPLRAGQEWCLNCGAAVSTYVAGARGWRTPIAIVSVVLLLAAVGLLVAFLELSDDADRTVAQAPSPTPTTVAVPGVVTPVPAASPVPTPSPTPAASPTPFPEVTITPAPSVTPGATVPGTGASPTPFPTPGGTSSPFPTSSPSGSSGTVSSWPSGRTAYTVILLSGRSESGARKKAREFAAGGTPVGVLRSSDYSSLRPGYWVVFSGQYETSAQAKTAAEGLRSRAPQAYPRQIKP